MKWAFCRHLKPLNRGKDNFPTFDKVIIMLWNAPRQPWHQQTWNILTWHMDTTVVVRTVICTCRFPCQNSVDYLCGSGWVPLENHHMGRQPKSNGQKIRLKWTQNKSINPFTPEGSEIIMRLTTPCSVILNHSLSWYSQAYSRNVEDLWVMKCGVVADPMRVISVYVRWKSRSFHSPRSLPFQVFIDQKIPVRTGIIVY